MNRRRTVKLLLLLLGLALFVYLVRRTGWAEVAARVYELGAGFLLLLALAGMRTAVRALAWLFCLTNEERAVGFGALWRARLIGDAAGQLTTAGPLVAEPVRVKSLAGLSWQASVSSLTVETLTYTLSSCLLILAGTLTLLGAFALDRGLQTVGLIAASVMVLIVAVTVAGAVWRWRLMSTVGALIGRGLHSATVTRRAAEHLQKLHLLENHVFDFYAERRRDFLRVAACDALFHLLAVAETYATLRLTGYDPTPAAAFALEATNRVISMIFSFIPARLGVDEAGAGLLTQALGLGATAGVTLAVVRKARILCWTAVGLALFVFARRRQTIRT